MARAICGLSCDTIVSVYEYLNKYSVAGRIEIGHEAIQEMLPDTNNDWDGRYKMVNISDFVSLVFDPEQSTVYVEELKPDTLETGLGMFWMLDCTDVKEWIDGPDEDIEPYDGNMDK